MPAVVIADLGIGAAAVGGGPPTFDNANGNNAVGGDPLTVSLLISGSNNLLVIPIVCWFQKAVSSVTYNSVTCSQYGTDAINSDTGARISLWYLIAPDTGTHDVSIVFSGPPSYIAAMAVNLNNANQSTPFGTFFPASGSNSSDPQVVVTGSNSNELVIDGVLWDATSGDTANAGSNQTKRGQQIAVVGDLHLGVACSTEIGAASTPMDWTITASRAHWAQWGVAVKAP